MTAHSADSSGCFASYARTVDPRAHFVTAFVVVIHSHRSLSAPESAAERGFLAHEGKNYHVGEAFAEKPVGLRLNRQEQTELYFANVHLGNLTYDAEGGRFKPTAYIAAPTPATDKNSRPKRLRK